VAEGFESCGPARANYALDHVRFVAVETADHRRFHGLVSETQADGFVLLLESRTTTSTYAEVEHITWQHHMPRPVVAVLAGAAVAGALYALVHLLLAKNGSSVTRGLQTGFHAQILNSIEILAIVQLWI
jgi:hypothetical protein